MADHDDIGDRDDKLPTPFRFTEQWEHVGRAFDLHPPRPDQNRAYTQPGTLAMEAPCITCGEVVALLNDNRPRLLNWGAGPRWRDHPDWVASDRDDHGQDHVGDIRDGLPFDDGAMRLIVSHHALQMLPWAALVPALAELRRVTARGGWFRLSVPDAVAAFLAYRHFHAEHFRVADEHEASLDGKFCLYLSQSGSTRSVFTGPWLCELLERAGWVSPCLVGYTATTSPHVGIIELDSRPDESLFVEATK